MLIRTRREFFKTALKATGAMGALGAMATGRAQSLSAPGPALMAAWSAGLP